MNADALVYPWRHEETGVQFPPLIHMLENAIATGTEHSRGGGTDPSTRSVVAVDALDVLRRLDNAVPSFIAGMPRLWRFRAIYYWASETHSERWLDRYKRWADDIWDLFEPAKIRALRNLACPACGSTHYVTADGTTAPPLIVHVDGPNSRAECRNCAKTWFGMAGLTALGVLAGTKPDMDALSDAIAGETMSDR